MSPRATRSTRQRRPPGVGSRTLRTWRRRAYSAAPADRPHVELEQRLQAARLVAAHTVELGGERWKTFAHRLAVRVPRAVGACLTEARSTSTSCSISTASRTLCAAISRRSRLISEVGHARRLLPQVADGVLPGRGVDEDHPPAPDEHRLAVEAVRGCRTRRSAAGRPAARRPRGSSARLSRRCRAPSASTPS